MNVEHGREMQVAGSSREISDVLSRIQRGETETVEIAGQLYFIHNLGPPSLEYIPLDSLISTISEQDVDEFVDDTDLYTPIHELLLLRMRRIIEHIPLDRAQAALTASEPMELMRVVESALAPETGHDDVPLIKRALERGFQAKERLSAQAGGLLSVREVATQLGLTDEAIRKKIRNDTLIGIRSGKAYKIPAFQIEGGVELEGLSEVLGAMAINSPWMRLDWLLNPESRLDDQRPIDVLRRGDREEIKRVVDVAERFGEHGAA